MRCDACKFWELSEDDWTAKGVGFGICSGVRERWEIQDAASKDLEWDADESGSCAESRATALREARAYVQDGSEYVAELITGPDFFCALFKALETTPE